MGWYANQSARHEAHKAEMAEAKRQRSLEPQIELRADIAAAADALLTTFGAKREIRKLQEHLLEGELVEQLTTGTYGKGTGLLARTDRRLLFLQDGWTGATSEDFPFSKISSVQWASGVLTGTITIFASGNTAEIRNVPQESRTMVDAVRAVISQPAAAPIAAPAAGTVDVAAQLGKLADLHAAGVLTDAEFTAKKAEMLARM